MFSALIFDVDGTLAETEEAHRQAFNLVFERENLGWHWDVEFYRELLRVTGGKERIAAYLARVGLSLPPDRIVSLHLAKNAAYAEIVRSGGAALRPGIADIVAGAREANVTLAICTTTSRANIEALLEVSFSPADRSAFRAIITGEDVQAKKPDPEAYLLTLQRLGLAASQCLALEDSRNGVEAAKAAGVAVAVSPSLYTSGEAFPGALHVVTDWTMLDWRGLTIERPNVQ